MIVAAAVFCRVFFYSGIVSGLRILGVKQRLFGATTQQNKPHTYTHTFEAFAEGELKVAGELSRKMRGKRRWLAVDEEAFQAGFNRAHQHGSPRPTKAKYNCSALKGEKERERKRQRAMKNNRHADPISKAPRANRRVEGVFLRRNGDC